MIHRFNDLGMTSLDPQWAGGRPRRITTEDEAFIFIVKTAKARPEKAGRPFTHWSVRKLREPEQVPSRLGCVLQDWELGSCLRQDPVLRGRATGDLRGQPASAPPTLGTAHGPHVARLPGLGQPERNRRRTQAQSGLAGSRCRTSPVKGVGELCAGEPHAQFDGGELEKG